MNRPDDDFDLQDHLSRAIGTEPPMASTPEHDTARGRKMLRRRRLAAVATSAAVVPALALGGWAVNSSLDSGSGSVEMRPAGSAGPSGNSATDAADPTAPDCTAISVDSASGAPADPPDDAGIQGTLCPVTDDSGNPGSCDPVPNGDKSAGTPAQVDVLPAQQGIDGSAQSGNGHLSDGGDSMTLQPGNSSMEADGEATLTATCVDGGDVGDISTPEIDRVQSALDRVLDPHGEHMTSSIAGGSLSNGDGSPSDTPEGIYVGAGWVDGDTEGSVSLSVEDASLAQPGCLDQSLAVGPDVTCEVRTLEDGSTVWVGHGSQDGAERLAVRYERPDGSVVWATADQAGEQYWTDGTGAAPLAQLPATVDQLIALAQDADVHL